MFVTVRLIKPWAGQPAGTVIHVRAAEADRLIQRRQAVAVLRADIERAVTGPVETRG